MKVFVIITMFGIAVALSNCSPEDSKTDGNSAKEICFSPDLIGKRFGDLLSATNLEYTDFEIKKDGPNFYSHASHRVPNSYRIVVYFGPTTAEILESNLESDIRSRSVFAVMISTDLGPGRGNRAGETIRLDLREDEAGE